jgi:hypothetical protein
MNRHRLRRAAANRAVQLGGFALWLAGFVAIWQAPSWSLLCIWFVVGAVGWLIALDASVRS